MNTKFLISTAIVAAGFMAIQPAYAGGLSLSSFGRSVMSAPKAKPTFLGSSSFEGRTTSVFRNPDASHTVITRDPMGKATTEIHPKPSRARSRSTMARAAGSPIRPRPGAT